MYYNTEPMVLFSVLFCVDSKALKNEDNRERCDIIFEIKYLIHCLIMKGSCVDFCWVPSHCGILHNELADRAAKKGALNTPNSTLISIACHGLKRRLVN